MISLKNKTVFDFCKDEAMLHSIIGGKYSEAYYKGFPPPVIASHLLEYAMRTNNGEMVEAAQRLLQSETDKQQNRIDEAQQKGQIID